jgi:radical SAM superfamily enzyme YgiQ (UPF0313 family)
MNGLCSPTLDKEVLAAMAAAGFKQVNLSYVTHDESLREGYRRPRARGKFEDVVRAAQALGLFVTAYVIIGLPGQTCAEIKKSIDYLLGLGVLVGPSVFYLPPGSELFDKVRVAPEVKDNWDFYRSSAFAVETESLARPELIDLFLYARRRNLEKKPRPSA